MYYIINGCSGYIGKYLYEYLKKSGHQGMVVSKSPLPFVTDGWNYNQRDKVMNKSFRFSTKMQRCLINLETKQQSIFDWRKKHYNKVINNGLSDWLGWCEHNEINNIIQFSSIKATKCIHPIATEDNIIPAKSPYGSSKWNSEVLLKKWSRNSTDRKCIAMRISAVYGPDCRGKLKYIVKMMKMGLYIKQNLFNPILSLVSLNNLLSATEHLAAKSEFGFNTYNITDNKIIRLNDIYELTMELLNKKEHKLKSLRGLPKVVSSNLHNQLKNNSKPKCSAYKIYNSYYSPKKLIRSGYLHLDNPRVSLRNTITNMLNSN